MLALGTTFEISKNKALHRKIFLNWIPIIQNILMSNKTFSESASFFGRPELVIINILGKRKYGAILIRITGNNRSL